MPPIKDHPLRYELANELHARPFPALAAPAQALFLAIKQPQDAAGRDRSADRAHLLTLLDRFAAPHPQPEATHFFGEIGKHRLKWEQHTEFVTYTVFVDGPVQRPYDPALWEVFPEDWLDAMPGVRITSAHLRIEEAAEDAAIVAAVEDWFVPESLAVARVLDDTMVVAGDFRIDTAGHMRLALFSRPGTGPRRIGRVVQRLFEIETYKSMSMLGLPRARALSRRLGPIDGGLSRLVAEMTGDLSRPDETLSGLLDFSAELENLMAQNSFRFGATKAYKTIVHQRIDVLREVRFKGRPTLTEFMMRRFDPAMRTIVATEAQLKSMTDRALRASDLLRTRVDVDRSDQNQKLLESMDRRAALQLRLQKTVEGLSVVAISYYAVNLVVYALGPLAAPLGVEKTTLTSIAVIPVVALVWWVLHRIRRSMH